MIKFFRRIRQKLINEGNLKNYLTYAIGEIVLVVLGILIALQVNNWSLDVKEKSEEKKTLRELRAGFRLDLNDLSLNKKLTLKAANSCKIIIEQIENQLPFHDSLKVHFSNSICYTRFINNSGPYESLKIKGIELISNDTLRNQIVNMHDFFYQLLKTFEQGETLSNNYWIEFCTKHFDIVQMVTIVNSDNIIENKMTPINYEELKQNSEYMTLLKTMKSQNEVFVKAYLDIVILNLEHLIENIDKQLIK